MTWSNTTPRVQCTTPKVLTAEEQNLRVALAGSDVDGVEGLSTKHGIAVHPCGARLTYIHEAVFAQKVFQLLLLP